MTSARSDSRARYGWLPGREQYRGYSTITDCALFHGNVAVHCPSCGHQAVFDGHALWWLFKRKGWDDRLRAAARRFRCTRCWHEQRRRKRPLDVVVTEAPATSELPMPHERTWKRLVSRQRS